MITLQPNYKGVALLLATLLLSACQSIVRTDVATFHKEDAVFDSGSVVVLPKDGVATSNLEFAFYKTKLEQHLSDMGLSPTDSDDADFVARLGYSVSRQEQDKPNSRMLIGGHFGTPFRYGHSSIIMSDDLGAEFEYVREVSVVIERNGPEQDPEQLLAVNASSIGKCEHLTVVYDEMLEAIFRDIRRPNGSVENIKVKGEAACP